MKISYPQQSALSASFIFLVWELNLIFPEQKKYFTLLSILLLLLILVSIYNRHLRTRAIPYWKNLLKLKFWSVNLNYLLLPLFLTVSTAAFVKFLPEIALQQVVLVVSFFALTIIILNTNNIYASKLKASKAALKIFTLSKFYTIFLVYGSFISLYLNERLSLILTSLGISLASAVLFYLAARQHSFERIIGNLILNCLWIIPVFYLSVYLELNLFTSSMLLTIAYYLGWGLSQQKARQLFASEYFALGLLMTILLLANRLGQII